MCSHGPLLPPLAGDTVTEHRPDGDTYAPADVQGRTSGGALGGLLVADFGRVLAGPYATMLMADLGAEVIKIERPGTGDDTRAWGPPWADGQATYFQGVNRNKQSLAIDLSTQEGLAEVCDIAGRADVVVENFRPGVMARLGLDYETLRETNPRLVYCSISGFGSGEGAALPGYDLLAQALGGLMSVTGSPDGEPTKVGVALVDVITGLHAAVGILAAVRHAERTGEGQWVEVNLLSSLLSALANQAQAYVGAGVVPGRMGNRHPSISPYETFPTKDRLLVLAVGNDRQFVTLCGLLDLPEVATDPRFATNAARVGNRQLVTDTLTPVLRGQPTAWWVERLEAMKIGCGPINTLAQVFADPHVQARGVVVEMPHASLADGTIKVIANPVRLSESPADYRLPPPLLGQHTNEVLGGLGLDAAELGRLREKGVI